ncbi:hypothetical protein AeRB84_003755 [Aphanomyces euteiches]|nr:hypothetical protein AeRB84_003755 [Aphanomyces euteiches]
MVTLVCVVVGEGIPFSVEIDASKIVDVLKKKIKEEINYDGHAKDLELYRVDGLTQNQQRQILFSGTPIDMAVKHLGDFEGYTTGMVELSLISECFQDADVNTRWKIHVLVVVPAPAPSYASQVISWIDSINRWWHRPRVDYNCKALVSFMESEMTRKDTIISSPHLLTEESLQFRLTGREDAIETAMECYTKIIESSKTTATDRTKRTIPVCSGISGLGKTRMLEEGILILRNIVKEEEFNCIASVIVPYYNEYMPNPVEKTMSIEASFSWRLLYRFFLAGNCTLSFGKWAEKRLPSNGYQLTLTLALQVIQYKLSERMNNPPRLYLFLGIDEYQNIENVNAPRRDPDTSLLRELVETIGNELCSESSKFVLLPMFAGTDLHVISSIANSSSFVTQRLPMPLLKIQQVFSLVESAEEFVDLLEYAKVCRNLFFLGGVPRWVVDYLLALKVVRDKQPQVSTDQKKVLPLNMIEKCYTTFTEKFVSSAFSVLNSRQRLRLAAFALSGSLASRFLIMLAISTIRVPNSPSDVEKVFALAIEDLFVLVDSKLFAIPPWRSWEVFGACFYALRINALLVLGQSTVTIGDLLRGATMDYSTTSAIQFGQSTGKKLTNLGNTLDTIDWITSGCIALNGEGGKGVDIFFALEHALTSQVVVFVDQRKRQFGKFHPSDAIKYLNGMNEIPSFLTGVILVRGVTNCVSVSNLDSFTVPRHCFIVSREQSDEFHVNTANKTAIKSLFLSTGNEVDEVVKEIIRKRAEPTTNSNSSRLRCGFHTEDDLN